MAKCKLCKANIPDGTEYCSNCQEKGNAKANESYLDSLLNSVKDTIPAAESIYKKKNDTKSNNPVPAFHEEEEEQDYQDFGDYKVDLSDIEDFDQYFKDDDLSNISIGDEELFGENLSDIFEDKDKSSRKQKQESPIEGKSTGKTVPSEPLIMTELSASNASYDNTQQEPAVQADIYFTEDSQLNNTDGRGESFSSDNEEETTPLDDVADNFTPEEISEALESEEDDKLDSDINDLLNNLDSMQNNTYNTSSSTDKAADASYEDINTPSETEDFEQVEAEEDDFLSLLNQISSDDPVAADVKAINDLLSGRPVENQNKSNAPSNVGEVFSDALKVVSSLNDTNVDEEELLSRIPDKKDKDKKESKKQKASKKETKKEQPVKVEAEKPKIGLLKRLFGNVDDGKAAKKKAQPKKFNPEEAAATKEKVKKAKKGKKGAPSPDTAEEETLAGAKGKGKPAAEKVQDIKENKKDKKDKKKKSKEIIQVIDEIEEDEGRINRLGASIVFIFFGLLVILLLVGTNVVSYTLSIQHATDYFGKQKYNQAYKEVYGVEIQDKDIEIYEKIMTVMFVNKQLNSYNNYYALGEYPEALDSLLKGLKRYDKYLELATYLGIKTDLDYVRTQILAELGSVFNLSEEEAIKIIANDNMSEYSLEVYDVVLEKMNN